MNTTLKNILIGTAAATALSACTTMDDDAMMADNDRADTVRVTDRNDDTAMMEDKRNQEVGGAVMYDTRTIVQNASMANNLTTLVAAVKAAGLADTLSGPGPFTVFAPTDAAFDRLAPGTVDTLMEPANRGTLTNLLTSHVVQGDLNGMELMKRIRDGRGTATLTTVAGTPLKITEVNGDIAVTDGNGTTSYVQIADVKQSNGVVHVINGVLVPRI